MRISDWSSDVCSSYLMIDDRKRALLVGLNGKAKTLTPAFEQCVVSKQRLENVERQLQFVGFLGVDRKTDPGRPRFVRQSAQPRQQPDRQTVVEGKRVSRRVDIRGRRSIQQKRT